MKISLAIMLNLFLCLEPFLFPMPKDQTEVESFDVQPYLDYIEVALSIYHESLERKDNNGERRLQANELEGTNEE